MNFKNLIFISTLVFICIPTLARTEASLVLYKTSRQTPTQKLLSRDLRQYLITQTTTLEAQVFSGDNFIPASHRQNLWIAHATIVKLTHEQKQKIQKDSRVEMILPLPRKARLAELAHIPLRTTAPNYTYGLQMISLPAVNANYPELTGKGIKVGIIDTGIENTHSELSGKTVAFMDYISKKNLPYDDYGHGTHVAGVIAGSNASDKRISVAPDVKLFVAKAFSKYGGSDQKSLLLALQWMADPDNNPQTDDGPDILSNSWNVDPIKPAVDPQDDPFCRAIANLNTLGVSVVFSAGNDGPSKSSILPPGACPGAVTVASTNDKDQLNDSSSRGPAIWKTLKIAKPDIAAPGSNIYSSWIGQSYAYKSGTSMATPYVAGALALIKQMEPGLTPDELQAQLYKNSLDLGPLGHDDGFGHGRLDVLSSVQFLPIDGI